MSVRFCTASSARIYHIENKCYFPLGGRKMKGELEKEIERLNALLAIEDDEIMLLRERLLEAHSDAQHRLAEASAENARLRQEIEQLRESIVDPCR